MPRRSHSRSATPRQTDRSRRRACSPNRVEGGIRSHLEIEIEDRSHGASLTLDSFRTLSDAELNERLEKCNQVLKRTAPKVQ